MILAWLCRFNYLIKSWNILVQVFYSTSDQSKSASACHMTRSANPRRHSVVI